MVSNFDSFTLGKPQYKKKCKSRDNVTRGEEPPPPPRQLVTAWGLLQRQLSVSKNWVFPKVYISDENSVASKMTYELSDSSDATLALNDDQTIQHVCKYHKFGHCKFGKKCRHMHNDINYTKLNCDRNACLYRQPMPCKFVTCSDLCNFGARCSYAHPQSVSSKLEIEIDNLKVSLQFSKILQKRKTSYKSCKTKLPI